MLKQEFVTKVGQAIRKLREQKKISLEDLALEAGIEYSQLSRIENGKINTSIYSAFNIARSLGIPINELFHFNTNTATVQSTPKS